MSSADDLLECASKSPRPLFKDRHNFVPLPYRGVSVQTYNGSMTEHEIANCFLGRETYRRTEFIVLRSSDGKSAVIAVDASNREDLFAPIVHVEVLALPDNCSYLRDPIPIVLTHRLLPRSPSSTTLAKTVPLSAKENTITSISSIILVPWCSRSSKSLPPSRQNSSIWSATF
jgi:hypothetical protein